MNKLGYDNFELSEKDLSHQLTTMCYSFSKVLNQSFFTTMQKQKNSQRKLIYRKWPLPLPNVQYNHKTADIFPLLTHAFNEESINGTIEVLLDISGPLELTDDVVKSKVILLKRNLLTIKNARRAIYRWQDELLPLLRFHWLKQVAGLFHLQMNILSVVFDKF